MRYVVAESHLTICTELHLRWELHSVLCDLRTQLVSLVSLFPVAGSWKCSWCCHRLTTLHIQGVTGGTDQPWGECSLSQTIPI